MASFLLVAIVAAFTPLTNSKPSSLDVDIVPALPQEELSQTHIIHRRDTDYYRQALKVRGYRGTGVQRYKGTGVQGYRGTGQAGCPQLVVITIMIRY